MKRLTFKTQIRLGLALMILCFILSTITKQGIFHNIAWICYGLLFVVNPVWPECWGYADPVKMQKGARIAGVLAIIIGLITRFGV